MLDSRQGSDMTLPSGAIGVFNVPSDWTMNRTRDAPPLCDMDLDGYGAHGQRDSGSNGERRSFYTSHDKSHQHGKPTGG